MAYDAIDRLVLMFYPDLLRESVSYHDGERRTERADTAHQVSEERYDLGGHMVGETAPDGATRDLTYDLEGHEVRESTWFDADTSRSETELVYDTAAMLIRRIEPLRRVTTYQLDGIGQVIAEQLLDTTDPTFEPRAARTDYDELGRLIERRYADRATETFTCDPNGNLRTRTDPEGKTTTRTYGAHDRETLRTYSAPHHPVSEVLQSIASTWDANDNLLTVTEAFGWGSRTTNHRYDAFDHLISVTDTYDDVGNRTSLAAPDGSITRYDCGAYRLLAIDHFSEGRAFYHLDALCSPVALTGPDGTVEPRYEYGARGGRMCRGRQWGGTPPAAALTFLLCGCGRQRLRRRQKMARSGYPCVGSMMALVQSSSVRYRSQVPGASQPSL